VAPIVVVVGCAIIIGMVFVTVYLRRHRAKSVPQNEDLHMEVNPSYVPPQSVGDEFVSGEEEV